MLGIGDRHLDNLLLTKTGQLFHVDFGYILGRDPKPFDPPAMRLCREMVDLLDAERYNQFTDLCYITFLSLRKSANLFFVLFALMVNSNIPDFAIEPDKVLEKLQKKFLLELEDEEAIKRFKDLIFKSINDFYPDMMERLHKVAQYWKS